MFNFSLKMVGANGSQSRRIIGAIDVADITELAQMLNTTDFIVVEKFHEENHDLVQVGPEIIHAAVVGTVRDFKRRSERQSQRNDA